MRKITRSKTGNKRRFYYIFGVLAICAFMSFGIGYALITDTLDVNGTAQITSTWKVLFTKAVENEMNGATTVSQPVITGGTSLKLGVELDEPGSQAIYDVTVANQGTIDAKVTGITFNDGEPSDLVLEVSDFYTGFVLKAGETKTFQVVATWDANAPASDEMDKNVEVDIDFTQNTGEDTGPELSMPTYSVDYPNTTWTTEKNVTITYPEGDGFIYLYSLDGGKTWKTAPTASYTIKFTENGTLYIRVSNGTSFLQTPLITIEKVDSVAPTVQLLGNPTAWVKETTVRTSVSDSGGSGLASQAYSWTQGASWTSQNYRLITKNGNYSVWVRDNAGNITKVDFEVTKIDNDLPTINSFTRSTVTSSSITVNVRATQNKMGIAGYRFRINNGAWTSQQSSSTYTFTGLDKDTTYSIQAQAVGRNGLTRTSTTLNVTTNDIATPTYTLKENDDGTKTVTINFGGSKTSNLVYEYLAKKSIDDPGNWVEVSGSSVDVTFDNYGIVVARIRDTGNNNNTVTASSFEVRFSSTTLQQGLRLGSLTSIEFVNYLAPEGVEYIDVSQAQDNSIQLWTDSDGKSYIGSLSRIKANLRSSRLFSQDGGSNPLTSVYFNDYLDTSDVTDMREMFYNDTKLTVIDGISNLDTSKVTTMQSMFERTWSLTSLDLSDWNTQSVRNLQSMFEDAHSLTNLDVSGWNTSYVTDFSYVFSKASKLTSLDLSSWDTITVTNMSYMFNGTSSLETVIGFENWNSAFVTNMSYMFNDASKLSNLETVSEWTTSQVTNMSYMFSNCILENIDLQSWDTSSVTNMSGMFREANISGIKGIEEWNVSNVTNMSYMFRETNLAEFDFSKWETGNLNNISYMFTDNVNLTSVNLSNWNTSKVTNMGYLFDGCENLNSIFGIETWNTSAVTNMSYMFRSTNSLQTLNVKNWETGNVTTMRSMFDNTTSLASLDLSDWDTSKVTNMYRMFTASALSTLDVSGWNTSKVTDMELLFYSLNNLENLDLSSWSFEIVDNMDMMFGGCAKLTTSLTIDSDSISSYRLAFMSAATDSNAKITVYSIGTNVDLVKKIVATKSSSSNVVYGGVKS